MTPEETIKEELTAKFPFLAEKVKIARARRLWVDVPQDQFMPVFQHAIGPMKVAMLCTMTGLDEGATLGVIYHLANDAGIIVNLHTRVSKDNPVLQTVSGFFPAADAYERELVDLLGMDVRGLPPGHRYPLTDDWPKGEYPLRKDWKGRGAANGSKQEVARA